MQINQMTDFTTLDNLIVHLDLYQYIQNPNEFKQKLNRYFELPFEEEQTDNDKKISNESDDKQTVGNPKISTTPCDIEYHEDEFPDNESDWYSELIQHPKKEKTLSRYQEYLQSIENFYKKLPYEEYNQCIVGFKLKIYETEQLLEPIVLLISGKIVPHPNFLVDWNLKDYLELNCPDETPIEIHCFLYENQLIEFNPTESKDEIFMYETFNKLFLYEKIDKNLTKKNDHNRKNKI